ncbi:hypothetical protein B0H14DRAFT_3445705 [Mycena olivaceomarginata]|nr:hypothetical protein B0H14DRAFT_3445705 [Mycena olivaceomarginata]
MVNNINERKGSTKVSKLLKTASTTSNVPRSISFLSIYKRFENRGMLSATDSKHLQYDLVIAVARWRTKLTSKRSTFRPLANPISRKRKRELLDYVSVPPMPTAGGEKENALAASASDRDGKYRKGGNLSRKTKTGAGGKVHLSLEDAINTASAQNDRAGLILVPNAIGQAKRR